MKTIEQFVRTGINNQKELIGALQTALQLEFSTIPPYLCAEWSIDVDPSKVRRQIRGVVEQEMYHFANAGNMLSAIGETPRIAEPKFILPYPMSVLPGDIELNCPVDLRPLSDDQLDAFIQIEYPEFPPVAFVKVKPATIGEFYTTLSNAFVEISPTIYPNAKCIEYSDDLGDAVRIESIDSAVEVIRVIKQQGEGTEQSPEQPSNLVPEAHYYTFKQIRMRRFLRYDKKWDFTGDEIKLPSVYDFPLSNADPAASRDFNHALAQLLIDIESCWSNGTAFNSNSMIALRKLGTDLITQNIRPEFIWEQPVTN